MLHGGIWSGSINISWFGGLLRRCWRRLRHWHRCCRGCLCWSGCHRPLIQCARAECSTGSTSRNGRRRCDHRNGGWRGSRRRWRFDRGRWLLGRLRRRAWLRGWTHSARCLSEREIPSRGQRSDDAHAREPQRVHTSLGGELCVVQSGKWGFFDATHAFSIGTRMGSAHCGFGPRSVSESAPCRARSISNSCCSRWAVSGSMFGCVRAATMRASATMTCVRDMPSI